jgi:HEAT repeat protein
MNNTYTLLLSLLLAGAAGAQDLPTNDALRDAIARAELEHDDAAARDALAAIADDDAVDPAVRRHAWLRLAKLSRRRGDDRTARELLERAAAGTDAVARAAGELLEQDPQDPERARQLRERAEVALDRYLRNSGSLPDVLWFGDTAASLLIREYERLRSPSVTDPYQQLTGKVVAALWHLDSDTSRAFLAEQLGAADPGPRRLAVTAMDSNWTVPVANLPLLRTALEDSDALVVIQALSQWRLLGIDDLAPKIADPRVTVRLAALQSVHRWVDGLISNGETRNAPERREDSERIAAALPVPLAATDPAEFRLAGSLLCKIGGFSAAGRGLLARSLTKLGDAAGHVWLAPRRPDFAGVNENAAALRSALDELGPVDPKTATAGQRVASNLFEIYLYYDAWDRDALDAVLTGARLGYGSPPRQWLEAHALPDDAPRIVEATAEAPAFEEIAAWLVHRDLPESGFEPLRRIAERRMQAVKLDATTSQLLVALGRTGHPDAAPFLREVAAHPDSATRKAALGALAFAGVRRNDGATRDALRSALLAVETQDDVERGRHAARLFGQLVRMGDVEVFDVPDAVQEKFTKREPVEAIPGAGSTWSYQYGGPLLGDWLAVATRSEGLVDWWHGYTDAELSRLWQRLLAPRADGGWRGDWEAVDRLLAFVPGRRDGIPDALVLVLCEAFAARCATDDGLGSDPVLRALSKLVSRETRALFGDRADVAAGLDALRTSLWSAPSAGVRRAAAQGAWLPLDEERRARLVGLLADPDLGVAAAAWGRLIHDAGIPVDAGQVASGLSSPNAEVRRRALEFASTAPAGLGDAVRPALADPSEGNRALACSVLGATLRLEVVPELLAMLKDSSAAVREQARGALQSIRFYHDEKAHWDRVFAGKAGLTAASAAEALLDQARPGNDPETRVLAIRSLGVLAAPETLPFLITWTKDGDPGVAEAARAAIATIHTRG